MTTNKPGMRAFHIEYRVDWAKDDTHTKTLRAAYFKEEDGFVTFKDDANQAVYSIRNDALLLVERVDMDEHVAELEAILDAASRCARYTGSVTTRTRRDDGSVSVEEFEVTINLSSGGTVPGTS